MGLGFVSILRGITLSVFQDGYGNGIRSADILAGIDSQIEPAIALSDHFPDVNIGLTPNSPVNDPVQVGLTNIRTFTPVGTATSGTIYISDRAGTQWAVRVLGATGRTRVLRYDPSTQGWLVAY